MNIEDLSSVGKRTVQCSREPRRGTLSRSQAHVRRSESEVVARKLHAPIRVELALRGGELAIEARRARGQTDGPALHVHEVRPLLDLWHDSRDRWGGELENGIVV